jgi:hypothetical protein
MTEKFLLNGLSLMGEQEVVGIKVFALVQPFTVIFSFFFVANQVQISWLIS